MVGEVGVPYGDARKRVVVERSGQGWLWVTGSI